ncbi:MAG: hypothetical protein ACMXYD_04870 [Candidatus Woesearchaeota archaeon]
MTTIDLYAEYASNDPIYKILRRETASPRFKLFLLEKKSKDLILYQYTDLLALKPRSGKNFDKIFREHRNFLVQEGVETDANQEMIRHFSQTQTPYKDLEEEAFENTRIWCG